MLYYLYNLYQKRIFSQCKTLIRKKIKIHVTQTLSISLFLCYADFELIINSPNSGNHYIYLGTIYIYTYIYHISFLEFLTCFKLFFSQFSSAVHTNGHLKSKYFHKISFFFFQKKNIG